MSTKLPRLRTFRFVVAYEGTHYQGWQRQARPDAAVATIQGVIERELAALIQGPATLIGSGRTDAGVHARAQVAHARVLTRLSARHMRAALNARLPEDIRITACAVAARTFHARYNAISKTYRYTLCNASCPDIFQRRFQYWVRYPLHIGEMRAAARYLCGQHDFTSFCPGALKKNAVRLITELSIRQRGSIITIVITANGFLHTMVRVIVGTLLEVGRGKLAADRIPQIIAAADRAQAGPTAPAKGLCLYQVCYGATRKRPACSG